MNVLELSVTVRPATDSVNKQNISTTRTFENMAVVLSCHNGSLVGLVSTWCDGGTGGSGGGLVTSVHLVRLPWRCPHPLPQDGWSVLPCQWLPPRTPQRGLTAPLHIRRTLTIRGLRVRPWGSCVPLVEVKRRRKKTGCCWSLFLVPRTSRTLPPPFPIRQGHSFCLACVSCQRMSSCS